MSTKQFYLLGDDITSARDIELPESSDLEELQHHIAAHYSIVDPKGKSALKYTVGKKSDEKRCWFLV